MTERTDHQRAIDQFEMQIDLIARLESLPDDNEERQCRLPMAYDDAIKAYDDAKRIEDERK